jgi:hypothetical protein
MFWSFPALRHVALELQTVVEDELELTPVMEETSWGHTAPSNLDSLYAVDVAVER